ncbi:MAG: sodium:proton antiporter NhaD [bacterium]|nr:sodium:proton antiporter NhaD [bacterium]
MSALIASIVFICGYILIALESKVRVSKSAFALAMGGILWIILGFHDSDLVKEEMVTVAYDIFNVVVFLLAAMSLVEILVHYRVFDVIRGKIFKYKLSDRRQFLALTGLAFFLSAIIDNMTATIVMIQISRQFFKGRNMLVAAVGIVIAANAGGAFSPIGDVTTIMLWLAGKFEAGDIIMQGFLPSLALFFVMVIMMMPKVIESGDDVPDEIVEKLTSTEKLVVSLVGLSFLMPIAAKAIGLTPVLGILFGVGLTWIVIDVLKSLNGTQTHLNASIEHMLQKTDISSLQFFIGILLAVSALGALGVLQYVSEFVYGSSQSVSHVIGGNIVLGMASSFLDNIPLTAIAIDILHVDSVSLWVLLAISVGTGGSLLALGSAAGVIAMGMIKELSFEEYFKIGFIPALVSFAAAIAVWGVQYWMII